MSIKSFVVKSLAIYGLIVLARDITSFSIDEHVRKVEKAFAHQVVEVMFDDGSNLQVIFSSEKKANDALKTMNEMISARGFATVEDLKDIAGIEPEYHDTYYGWSNLSDVRVIRVKRIILDKYALHMPKAKRMTIPRDTYQMYP